MWPLVLALSAFAADPDAPVDADAPAGADAPARADAPADPPPLAAHDATGTLRVVPADPNGAPVSGATARLSRAGVTVLPEPDADGSFVAPVAPGRWALEVTAPLLLPWAREIDVAPGELLTVAVEMAYSPSDEIVVEAPTETQRLERSSESVTVVETEDARRQSSDLGEVMARTQGIGVRRGGGLGSGTRLSLNGLTDDQVRFFLDGVPLELAGHPFGIANVPVDGLERVEVHRGVVPVRLGADALGGAVELVTARPEGVGGGASWQAGSWDTHRLSGHVHAADARSGLRARASGFLDTARNDYPVDVEVADTSGRLRPATVHRFHDGYRAAGANLELGVDDRAWADTLTVRGFTSAFHREIQNNVVMSIPYGEPTAEARTTGGSGLWRHRPSERLEMELLVAATHTTRAFQDTGTCVYDWFGQCIRERAVAGEIASPPSDHVFWDTASFGRARVTWRPADAHGLTLTVSPTRFSRTGEDLLHDGDGRDPLTSRRDALQVVSGVEHRFTTRGLENQLFVKHYLQDVASEEPLPGGEFRDVDRTTSRFGLGDGLRVDLTRHLWLKLGYEWATRRPTPEEIFGDAVLVVDNLELRPETSHNANLGLVLRGPETATGRHRLDLHGFLREARDLVVLLGTDRNFAYHNVFGARSMGVEGAVGWTSPGDWLAVDLNGTWLDLRNGSSEGTFGAYAGDRIPNRPWLFANANLRLGASDVAVADDRLTLDLYSRYVHSFFRGWESVGLAEFKQTIPAQLSHTLALTYAVETDRGRVGASVEVQNLTDADLYDFFGVQRPGRSVYGKLTVSR